MNADAKYAHTITSSISQVGAAILNPASASEKNVKDGCAAALRTVKEAVNRLSKKHKAHAVLLIKPLEAACQFFVQASTSDDEETRTRSIKAAQRAVTLALKGAQALEKEIAPVAMHGDSHMEGLDWLGEESEDQGGTDIYSSIVKTIGGIGQGAINYVKNKKAADAASADVEAKVQAAIAADRAATGANVKALVSEALAKNDPSKAVDAVADRAAADAAAAAQDRAGAAVPDAGRAARLAAAQAAVDAAIAKIGSTSGPMKLVAQFTLQAAQATLAKAQSAGSTTSTAMVKSDGSAAPSDSGALKFITAKFGPLPRYAYVLITAALYGGYRVLRKSGK